jgi:hypothetical protein
MDETEAVLHHYGTIREEQRISVGLGQLELLRTREILRRHLPPPPARVLDIGGATGVHASSTWHHVTSRRPWSIWAPWVSPPNWAMPGT